MHFDGEKFIEIADSPGYLVSATGRVISVKSGTPRLLLLRVDARGYSLVQFSWGRQNRRLCTVHRLVAQTFIPNPENKPQVNHIDGVKTNNRVANLEWVTPKENSQHDSAMGLMDGPKGERCARHILNDEDIAVIKARIAAGDLLSEIAKTYGVSWSCIRDIRRNRCWKHIV